MSGALLAGCGGSSSTNKKDASTSGDGSTDAVMVKKDGPTATDIKPGMDTSLPPDAMVKMDTTPAVTDGPVVIPDTSSTDTGGSPTLDTSPGADVTVTPDTPVDSANPGTEVGGTGGTTADGGSGTADVPVTTGGTVVDAAATDSAVDSGGGIDPDAPSDPAVITGWPVVELDFGKNPCGGPAPAPLTFTLTNAGKTAATIASATFTKTLGYTTDAAGKSIPPNGGTLVVSVTSPIIPTTASIEVDAFNDTLTLTTNIPGDTQHLVSITQSAKGAILEWDTSLATQFGSFGSQPPGQSTQQLLRVVNSGNLEANIALVTTTPFSIGPTNPTVVTTTEAQDFNITFTAPNAAGPADSTLALTLSTPVALCKPLPDSLLLTGTSINGAIAVSAQSLVFYAQCGASAADQTITITNTGTASMTWNGAMAATSSIFSISPTNATLPAPNDAGTSTSSTVTVQAAAPGHTRTWTEDVLVIGTDITGDTPRQVSITQIPLGDDITLSPSTGLDFGMVPIASPAQQSAPLAVTFTNSANLNSAPAVLTLSLSGAEAQYFDIVPTTLTIAAGEIAEASLVFKPGSDTAIVTAGNFRDLSATLNWQVGSEPNCGTASGNKSLTGRATLATVNITPQSYDFGLVNCGAQAQPLQITIKNTGSAAYDVTALSLANAAALALTAPEVPFTIPAAGEVAVIVTPNPIPATLDMVPKLEAFSGSLTVTTNAINDTPHTIPLTMGAKGVIISIPLSSYTWNFQTPIATGDYGSFKVYARNDGNANAIVELVNVVKGTNEPNVFYIDTQENTVYAGTTSNGVTSPTTSGIVARFQPNAPNTTWNTSGTLVLSPATNEVLCQPLPASWTSPTITLQGVSTSGGTH